MIAALAVYAYALSSLIGLLAAVAERGLITLRRPVRGIWVSAMAAMTVAPLVVTVVTPRPAASTVSAYRLPAPSRGAAIPGAAQSTDVLSPSWTAPLRLRTDSPTLPSFWQRLISLAAPLDGWLGIAWGMLSLALAVYAACAVRATNRLPVTMPVQTIGRTVVRVSDTIGPAAIGGAMPSIVLPRWVLDLDAQLLDLIVRHEQEHLHARDPRLLMFSLMWLVLMPWHLPLWWAWRRLRLAIELDCDARVLRGLNGPRVYAQLLLYIGQRGRSTVRPSVFKGLTLSVPLAIHTQGHHLKRRISAMTTPSSAKAAHVAAGLAALGLTGALAFALPAPRVRLGEASSPAAPNAAPSVSMSRRAESRVIVKVTQLGLLLADVSNAAAPTFEIIIYGDGPVKVGIGTDVPTTLRDTIRLDRLPAFTADVSNGAVHIELRKAGGSIELGGSASGSPMSTFTVRGRHVVLDKGGAGVRAVPSAGGVTNRSRPAPTRRSPSGAGMAAGEDDLRLADSVGFRVARLEMGRAKLLTNLSADALPVREMDAQLNALMGVAGTLSSAARARAALIVSRLLAERRDGLRLELEQLRTTYEETSPLVASVAQERALLETRLKELTSIPSPSTSVRR